MKVVWVRRGAYPCAFMSIGIYFEDIIKSLSLPRFENIQLYVLLAHQKNSSYAIVGKKSGGSDIVCPD